MRSLLPAGFVTPRQPSPAPIPPAGAGWLHEIKHDGFRLMVRRRGRVRLFTRNGHDWAKRYPTIAAAGQAPTIKVGSSGASALRLSLATPSAPSLPARTSGSRPATSAQTHTFAPIWESYVSNGTVPTAVCSVSDQPRQSFMVSWTNRNSLDDPQRRRQRRTVSTLLPTDAAIATLDVAMAIRRAHGVADDTAPPRHRLPTAQSAPARPPFAVYCEVVSFGNGPSNEAYRNIQVADLNSGTRQRP